MKRKNRYIIEKETYSHGDLYELIEDITYRVKDKQTNKILYTFKGTIEYDYGTGGTWKHVSSSGVTDVSFSDDYSHITVTKESAIINIKLP